MKFSYMKCYVKYKHVIFHFVFLVMLDFATNSKTRVKYKVSDFQFDIIRDLVYASKFRNHTCSNANSFEYSIRIFTSFSPKT